MGRVALRRLVLFNFRSFAGRHSVDFNNGLVIVRGRNRDTGGDSGAGKTNVLLAIAYLFGYCRYSAKALQCWYDEDPFYVEAELDTVEGPVTVKRTGKGLSFGKVRGRAAEEKLDALCGVPAELREALTYRDQIKPLRFLAMKDREMKEFLFQVLGLGNLEGEIGQRTKRLGELERQYTSDANTLAVWRDSVGDRLTPPTHPVLEHAEDLHAKLDTLKAHVQRCRENEGLASDELADIPEPDQTKLTALRKAVREADFVLELVTATERGRVRAWEEEISVMRRELRQAEAAAAEIPALRKRSLDLEGQATKLKSDLCAMCERQWDHAASKLKEVEGALALNELKIEEWEMARDDIPGLRSKMLAHAFVPDDRVFKIKATREGLVVKLAQASQGLQDATKLAQADALTRLAQARQALAEAQREASQAQSALNALLQRNVERVNAYEATLTAHKDAVARQLQYEVKVEQSRAEFERETDYLELLKGFRNRIFDEVLASIGSEATTIIAGLPNAQHVSIEFRSERQTDKGAVQERITPVALLHGIERTLEEAVSGGQLTSLMLAVDLAVVRVISARLGCNLNWIVLDESFNGHDTVTKAGCLEMLQTYAQDKLVIIVDHSSEFKEMFSQTVVVDHNQKMSSIA